jgi:hypothetical protein
MRFQPEGDLNYQLNQLLNGGLTLYDNLRGAILNVTLVEGFNEVRHGLGYTPLGYLVLVKQNEGDIYGTETEKWDKEILCLVSSAPSQKVRLFVM